MSEEQHAGGYAEDGDAVADEPVERTGNAEVDAVLGSLEGLDRRPLDEQVAVFEAAHESLRAALSDAGRRPAPAAGSPGVPPAPRPGPSH